MKSQSVYNLFSFIFAVLVSFSLNANTNVSADSTGYPGDGFSLEGALELFKESKSLEDFEKKLNSEDNYVNNLDLNEDGEVDYIRVIDNMEDKSHAITLQVPLNEKESQDVAVIGIEEQGKENAVLQIIGDEDVYGEETLVEPFEEEAKSNGKGGPSANARIARIVVNVYFWPCVRFIYHPTYVVYVSPWRWHYYPRYWRPWRPHPWRVCHTHRVRYHRHYHVTHTHRVVHAHRVYTPHRRTTTTVRTRTTTVRTVKKSKVSVANQKAKTANKKASVANKKATTANKKASVANQKATKANQKAKTANKKANVANKKATTANKKANAANRKANTANKKTNTANKKTNAANRKANTANRKANAAGKSRNTKPSKAKTSRPKGAKQGNRSGGKKGRRN